MRSLSFRYGPAKVPSLRVKYSICCSPHISIIGSSTGYDWPVSCIRGDATGARQPARRIWSCGYKKEPHNSFQSPPPLRFVTRGEYLACHRQRAHLVILSPLRVASDIQPYNNLQTETGLNKPLNAAVQPSYHHPHVIYKRGYELDCCLLL